MNFRPAIFFLSLTIPTAACAGEPEMKNVSQLIFQQADSQKLEQASVAFSNACSEIMSGNISPLEANQSVFSIFQELPAESVLLVYLSSESARTDFFSRRALSDKEKKIYLNAAAVGERLMTCGDQIAPFMSSEAEAQRYLQQAVSLNAALLEQTNLRDFDPSSAEEFQDFSTIAAMVQGSLGYNDYEADRPRDAYWPSGDYFKGNHKFIEIFRTSAAEKKKTAAFEEAFDSLPDQKQALLYAWVYHASFEDFFSGSPIPDDLPPWISSPDLRHMHQIINQQVMQDFERREEEMLD